MAVKRYPITYYTGTRGADNDGPVGPHGGYADPTPEGKPAARYLCEDCGEAWVEGGRPQHGRRCPQFVGATPERLREIYRELPPNRDPLRHV